MTRHTPHRRRKAVIACPNDLDIVTTREFDAPLELVFDVMTNPEHLRKTIAPFGETVTVCETDLRVGGNYHFVFVTSDGKACSFRGTYLKIDPPTRTVATWRFEGWPDVEAVESMELHGAHGVTTLTWTLAFRDTIGRDHMTTYDGIEANLDKMEDLMTSLLGRAG
jgi:uncharacterized protein YndB with AHSA1/START domain